MKPVVADASAILAILLKTSDGESLLPRVLHGETVAPQFLATEIANGLWKYLRRGDLELERASLLLARGIGLVNTWWSDLDLAPEALRIAAQTQHPVYDSTYLALAKRVGATTILTLDRGLGALAESAGLRAVP